MTYLLNLIIIGAVALVYSNGAMACDGGGPSHPKCQMWSKITAKEMLNHSDPQKICEAYANAVDGCEDIRAFRNVGADRALDIIAQRLLNEIKKPRSPYKDEYSPELIFNLLMNCEFSQICFPADHCPEYFAKIEQLVKENLCKESSEVLDKMISDDCGYGIVVKAKELIDKCGALVCTEEASKLIKESMLKLEPQAAEFMKVEAKEAVVTYDAATLKEGDMAAIEKATAAINRETELYAKALEPTVKIVDAIVADQKACAEAAAYADPMLKEDIDAAKLNIEMAQARTAEWKNADLAKQVVELGEKAKAPMAGIGFDYRF